MHNYALTYQQAAVLAVLLLVAAFALRRTGRAAASAPFVREVGTIAALYSLWQYAGSVAVTKTDHALDRARAIERLERTLHLPSEAALQRPLLEHPVLAELADLYYAGMHFGGLFVFLLWLFVRHRAQYPRVRLTIIGLTLSCLLVQLVPVAPPRLLPGYVDVAEMHGQSVYGAFAGADQLSAMPSVHVGWAVLVAVAAARVSTSPWRWIGWVHALLTMLVVVMTANHWWLDGIVAVAILVVVEAVQWAGRRALERRAAAQPSATGQIAAAAVAD